MVCLFSQQLYFEDILNLQSICFKCLVSHFSLWVFKICMNNSYKLLKYEDLCFLSAPTKDSHGSQLEHSFNTLHCWIGTAHGVFASLTVHGLGWKVWWLLEWTTAILLPSVKLVSFCCQNSVLQVAGEKVIFHVKKRLVHQFLFLSCQIYILNTFQLHRPQTWGCHSSHFKKFISILMHRINCLICELLAVLSWLAFIHPLFLSTKDEST